MSPRGFSSAHVQDIAATATAGGGVHPYYESEWGDFFYSILCERAVIDRGVVGSGDDLLPVCRGFQPTEQLQTCRHPAGCEGYYRSSRTGCEPDGEEAKRERPYLETKVTPRPQLSSAPVPSSSFPSRKPTTAVPSKPSPPLRLQVLL